MVRFLLKGVLRDRSRSLLSFIIIGGCVTLTVFLRGFFVGFLDDMLRQSAVLLTGHVKVTTRAYAEEADLLPNNLAILEADSLLKTLSAEYPDLFWSPRITFAGLLDIPDENGETRSQSPMMGIAVDLLSEDTQQPELWDLAPKITRGRLPREPAEILLGEEFASRLEVEPGETATFIGSTMHGGFTTYNFHVAGTVSLGVSGLGDYFILADMEGAQQALDMEGAASEIFGFYNDMYYDDPAAVALKTGFNAIHNRADDEYSPFMQALRDQNQMGQIVDYAQIEMWVIILIFMTVVTIVLWNLGLMNGLRRYGEFGMRLAMGETQGHVFRTTLGESAIIGLGASVVGTAIGLLLTWWVQEVGIDYSSMMEGYDITMTLVMRAKVTPDCWFIGFIPGVLATMLGTMLAGRGIYKRQLSQLFKELELEA
ncbi:ABC transporter permease [Candidatus Neomarinimicrobiota bacterium]